MSDEKLCMYCTDGQRSVHHMGTGEYHTFKCFCQYNDLQFPVVIQSDSAGCAIAAIATLAQLTYKDVRHLIHIDRDFTVDGTYENEIADLLTRVGFAYQHIYEIDRRINTKRTPWPPEPWAPAHLAFVKNLSETGYHFVVVQRDGRVLDPWWGVIQGLHRYSDIVSMFGCFRVAVSSIKNV